VNDAGWNEPSLTGSDLIGAGKGSDMGVAAVKIFDAAPHILFPDASMEAQEGRRPAAGIIIELRREIVAFRLCLTADPACDLGARVEVEVERCFIVKEL